MKKKKYFISLALVVLLLIEIIPLYDVKNNVYADAAVNYTGKTNVGAYSVAKLEIQDIKISGNTTVERGGITTLTAKVDYSNLAKQIISPIARADVFNNTLPQSGNVNSIQSIENNIQYNGQTGPGNYCISTIAELEILAGKVNSGITYKGSTFKLTNDLFYNVNKDNNFTPIGNDTSAFEGTFNGNGCTINGLNYNTNLGLNLGFFRYIKNGEITNLKLSNTKMFNGVNVGSIVGKAENSIFENCAVENSFFDLTIADAQFLNSNIGGLVGFAENSTFEKCINYSFSFGIGAAGYAIRKGGLVGFAKSVEIKNSGNLSNVILITVPCSTGLTRRVAYGGLAGFAENLIIDNSFNSGNIQVNAIAGGLVGETSIGITILNSYNTGDIVGYVAGGLVGCTRNSKSTSYVEYVTAIVENSFNQGDIISAASAGGLFGAYQNGKIVFNNVYVTGNINANEEIFGYIGYQYICYEYAGGLIGECTASWDGDTGIKYLTIEVNNAYVSGNIDARQYYDKNNPDIPIKNIYCIGECIENGKIQSLKINNFNYIDTIQSLNNTQYKKSSVYLQSDAFINSLNSKSVLFTKDIYRENKGYPVFIWQAGKFEYTWEIENSEIASVTPVLDGSGVILKGLKKGETTLRVSVTFKDKIFTKSITITVISPLIQTKEGYYLAGEEIEYITGYYDDENDTKYRDEFKYTHTYNRLEAGISIDNSSGQINYNDKWLSDSVDRFSKVGAYKISYRVKDNPPTANKTGFENYRYYSEPVDTTIYIHRKPIANYTVTNNKVTDNSYDLDHSISYSNKGIIKWEWTYVNDNGNFEKYVTTNKIDGQNKVNDWLSAYLNTNYEILLRVQDMELAWSDVYSTNQVAKIQFNANLRTELEKFSLNSVPASENLLAFDIWTKYPKNLKLQLALYNNLEVQIAPLKEINYSTSTAVKMGQEIYWNDILYNIPATLICGNYVMKIKAVDVLNPLVFENIDFNVSVNTPINLQPILDSEIRAGKNTLIAATTSKYVNSAYTGSGVKVTLFDGTSYATTLTMNGTNTNWSVSATLNKSIPQGSYKAKFVATLPSGEFEAKEVTYNYVVNTAPEITDGIIYAELGGSYIYENDDVNYTLKFNDVDLSPLTVNIKLFKSTNTTTPIKEYTKMVTPTGTTYAPYTVRLIDDIPLGDYVLRATVTDDYSETATITTNFTAHDLWISGAVTHTDKWEENRQTYNAKYPSKARAANTYWSGEAFETSANTTVINPDSRVVCNKVSVEIINNDNPSDNHYLQWLSSDNTANDKWSLSYWDKEWISKDGYIINKWGADKKQELILRFTAYFNNDWVETFDVKIYIDNREDYWKLHRAW